MRELIGKSLDEARAELAGKEFTVLHNCDSVDGYDRTIVTAVRQKGSNITLIVSDFKIVPNDNN